MIHQECPVCGSDHTMNFDSRPLGCWDCLAIFPGFQGSHVIAWVVGEDLKLSCSVEIVQYYGF